MSYGLENNSKSINFLLREGENHTTSTYILVLRFMLQIAENFREQLRSIIIYGKTCRLPYERFTEHQSNKYYYLFILADIIDNFLKENNLIDDVEMMIVITSSENYEESALVNEGIMSGYKPYLNELCYASPGVASTIFQTI